jgi:hypothetical protein
MSLIIHKNVCNAADLIAKCGHLESLKWIRGKKVESMSFVLFLDISQKI